MRKFVSILIIFVFFLTQAICPGISFAQILPHLPLPGTMISASQAFIPPLLRGVTIHPENSLKFDFLLDHSGNLLEIDEVREQGNKLIRYFLAALAMPEGEMWVNLSPTQEDRIVTDKFGQTEMGRDLLAQDYLLKQLSASLFYPEKEIGQKFWKRIREKLGDTLDQENVSISTFSRVWIVPDKATVFEEGNSAYVVDCRLKVMLEEDYRARNATKNLEGFSGGSEGLENAEEVSQIMREVVIPELEREVNEGAMFAPLRQVYYAMVLSVWYKERVKESLLSKVYVEKSKVKGIDLNDPQENKEIYDQYMQALRKGVFNYIKEEADPVSGTIIPRKYFSGGVVEVRPEHLDVVSDAGDARVTAMEEELKGNGSSSLETDLLSVSPEAQEVSDQSDPLRDGGGLKHIGSHEDMVPVPQEVMDAWRKKADRVRTTTIPVRDINGKRHKIRAKFIRDSNIHQTGRAAHHFYTDSGELVIVTGNRGRSSKQWREAVYHESREAVHEKKILDGIQRYRGFVSPTDAADANRRAHILASYEQKRIFARFDAERNVVALTPYHRYQIETMSTERLIKLSAEKYRGHQEILIKAYFGAQAAEFEAKYQKVFREVVVQTLEQRRIKLFDTEQMTAAGREEFQMDYGIPVETPQPSTEAPVQVRQEAYFSKSRMKFWLKSAGMMAGAFIFGAIVVDIAVMVNSPGGQNQGQLQQQERPVVISPIYDAEGAPVPGKYWSPIRRAPSHALPNVVVDKGLGLQIDGVGVVARLSRGVDGSLRFSKYYDALENGKFVQKNEGMPISFNGQPMEVVDISIYVPQLKSGDKFHLLTTPFGRIVSQQGLLDWAVKINENGEAVVLKNTDTAEVLTYQVELYDPANMSSNLSNPQTEWLSKETQDMPQEIKDRLDAVRGLSASLQVEEVKNILNDYFEYTQLTEVHLKKGKTWMQMLQEDLSQGQKLAADCDILSLYSFVMFRYLGVDAAFVMGYAPRASRSEFLAQAAHALLVYSHDGLIQDFDPTGFVQLAAKDFEQRMSARRAAFWGQIGGEFEEQRGVKALALGIGVNEDDVRATFSKFNKLLTSLEVSFVFSGSDDMQRSDNRFFGYAFLMDYLNYRVKNADDFRKLNQDINFLTDGLILYFDAKKAEEKVLSQGLLLNQSQKEGLERLEADMLALRSSFEYSVVGGRSIVADSFLEYFDMASQIREALGVSYILKNKKQVEQLFRIIPMKGLAELSQQEYLRKVLQILREEKERAGDVSDLFVFLDSYFFNTYSKSDVGEEVLTFWNTDREFIKRLFNSEYSSWFLEIGEKTSSVERWRFFVDTVFVLEEKLGTEKALKVIEEIEGLEVKTKNDFVDLIDGFVRLDQLVSEEKFERFLGLTAEVWSDKTIDFALDVFSIESDEELRGLVGAIVNTDFIWNSSVFSDLVRLTPSAQERREKFSLFSLENLKKFSVENIEKESSIILGEVLSSEKEGLGTILFEKVKPRPVFEVVEIIDYMDKEKDRAALEYKRGDDAFIDEVLRDFDKSKSRDVKDYESRESEKGDLDADSDENKDQAMVSNEVGGIDLNPAELDLYIKRDDMGIPLAIDQQPASAFNIEGIVPVIVNISPARISF